MKTEKVRVIDYAKSRKIQARDVIEVGKNLDMILNAMTLITYREATALDEALANNEAVDTTETLGELFKRILQENIQFHKERQRKRFERIDEMRAQGLPTPRRQGRTDRESIGAPQRDGDRPQRGENRRPRRLGPDKGDRPQRDGERRFNNDRPRRDGDRPQRDGERRFNNDRPRRDGDRPQRDGERRFNNDRPRRDGDRPQRDGERRFNNDRPRRDGDRPQRDGERRFNNDRPRRDGDRPQRGARRANDDKIGVARRLEEKKRDAERDAARGGRPPQRKGDRKAMHHKKRQTNQSE